MADIKAVRLYRPGDEIKIINLFREIFHREMTLEEWRWKYTGTGNTKVYSTVAVSETDGVVAHYGGMVHRMIYHGKEIRGLAIGDVMVHSRFRSASLFKKIAALVPEEAVKDGIAVGYGFPNERAMRLPEKLGLYEKIEDVFEASRRVNFTNNIVRFIYKLFPLAYDDNRIDALWEAVKSEIKLGIIRDREYLVWRYREHPYYKYELWGLGKRPGNRLKGLAVLRRDGERILIVDFVCGMGMMNILLQKIGNYSYSSGLKTLTLWFPQYLKSKISESGFDINPAGTCIPRTTHVKTLTKEDMAGKFFYTMGDTDFL